MKSIAIPTHVVVLFRRLVNVVSTLSISHHYFKHHHDESRQAPYYHLGTHGDLKASRTKTQDCEDATWFQQCRWEALLPFQEQWDNVKDKYINQASSISLPWWPSLFSSSSERRASSAPTPEKPDQTDHPRPPPRRDDQHETETPRDIIHQLIANPALSDPLRTPRYPIVLCHGLYGFDVRGPSTFPTMRMHYWANVLSILRGKLGAEVIVTSVPGTGNISSRSARLDEQLKDKARGRGVNMLAHSMGGLDCRHLITHGRPSEYTPLSLTTISTPHRGSPFMDWCVDNIGIGKLREQEIELLKNGKHSQGSEGPPPMTANGDSNGQSPSTPSSFNFSSLPSSFTTLLLSVVDSPAYANLTSTYLNDVFNPATPDDPRVKYWSVAGRVPGVSILHPFWFTKMIVDDAEEQQRMQLMQEHFDKHDINDWEPHPPRPPLWADEHEWGNDGLVTVQSAKWGEFLGVLDGCDHWEMRGARGIEFGVDLPAIPVIGLGVSTSAASTSAASAKKESSSTREWTRFLTGWKRDVKPSSDKESVCETDREVREPTLEEREHEFRKGDQVVRSSTERLSVVVDWLVEQIPGPQTLVSATKIPYLSTSGASDSGNGTQEQRPFEKTATEEMKKLSAEMVSLTAGSGASGIDISILPSAKPETLRKEVKKMMERERKQWRKNELETKADLERFYVAMARKMWDEGL
ncbi:lipase 2 [Coprinopsis cinerea AmutBmut pab1-1]|nr:lipase 2 [Coprinopsis cinerea AmutBmut pab1-1]